MDDRRIPIPAPTSRQRLAVGLFWIAVAGGMFLSTYLSLGRLIEESIGGGWWTVVGTVAAVEALVVGSVYAVIVRRTPAVEVDLGRGAIGLRGQDVPLSDVTGARAEAVASSAFTWGRRKGEPPAPDTVVLVLTTRQGRACRIVLLVGERRIQSEEATAALVAAVRASAVAPPTTPDDPDGRFTRINFPGHVDIEDAVALLEAPERQRVAGF
jgi:hypothetical protein